MVHLYCCSMLLIRPGLGSKENRGLHRQSTNWGEARGTGDGRQARYELNPRIVNI